ncbi:hypothetical protein [Paenibacillus lutimineralis]|nr:hypothetical protein [Paenibacillus lutimineralis]
MPNGASRHIGAALITLGAYDPDGSSGALGTFVKATPFHQLTGLPNRASI